MLNSRLPAVNVVNAFPKILKITLFQRLVEPLSSVQNWGDLLLNAEHNPVLSQCACVSSSPPLLQSTMLISILFLNVVPFNLKHKP